MYTQVMGCLMELLALGQMTASLNEGLVGKSLFENETTFFVGGHNIQRIGIDAAKY